MPKAKKRTWVPCVRCKKHYANGKCTRCQAPVCYIHQHVGSRTDRYKVLCTRCREKDVERIGQELGLDIKKLNN